MTIPSPGFRQKTLLLVRRLEEILQERGPLSAAEACRILLHTSQVAPPLAGRILKEMVGEDRRFRLDPSGAVALEPLTSLPPLRLREARFTVLDLETTGGSCGDRILEVGAVRVERGRIDGSFATLVNPGVPIPSFISSMTGIREEMVAGAPSFSAVAEKLTRFIGESVVVAHNLPFDLGFLNRELGRSCGFILGNPALCTVRLGRRLLPNLADRRLDTLADYYGLRFRDRHRALGDAEVTARLLLKFIVLLEEKGMEDLRAVERYLGNGVRPPGRGRVSGRKRQRQGSSPSASGES